MKKIICFLILAGILQMAAGQVKEFDKGLFQFKIKENYKLFHFDNSEVIFADTAEIAPQKIELKGGLNETLQFEGAMIEKKITISKLGINPKSNRIDQISDMANMQTLSMADFDFDEDSRHKEEANLDGITEIGNKEIYYNYSLTKWFSDDNASELQNYDFDAQYYFKEGNAIYQVRYQVSLLNDNNKVWEAVSASIILKKQCNLKDLNIVVESLKVREK